MGGRISFAYKVGRHFPIASDSYDDLIDMAVGESRPKEKLMDLSTVLPMLAEWCAILELPDVYARLRDAAENVFKVTNLQLWYPGEQTDNYLYKSNASIQSGSTYHSISLPESLERLKERIRQVQSQTVGPKEISCVAHGFPSLALIGSRHFRTPVLPFFWQRLIDNAVPATDPN
jgi:hypothetical protein